MTPFLGFVCAGVLGVIFSLGFWPFCAPANDVHWLQDRPGLSFGPYSGVMTYDALKVANVGARLGGSIEVWLQPARMWETSTFLALDNPDNTVALCLRQSRTDLVIQVGKNKAFHVQRIFRAGVPVFLAISAGEN